MLNKFKAKNLIKGKIVEIIFEEMFAESGDYNIIPFGYEKIVPELANYRKYGSAKKVLDNIRTSPDYALIMPDKKSIFLVEVKYRNRLDKKNLANIVSIAKKQAKRWHPSWIFLATLDGFYFSECSNIIKHNFIPPLDEKYISSEVQDKYLKLLNQFEK